MKMSHHKTIGKLLFKLSKGNISSLNGYMLNNSIY